MNDRPATLAWDVRLDHLSARGRVRLVAERSPPTRPRLDEDRHTGVPEPTHVGGHEGHPALALAGFAGHASAQRCHWSTSYGTVWRAVAPIRLCRFSSVVSSWR